MGYARIWTIINNTITFIKSNISSKIQGIDGFKANVPNGSSKAQSAMEYLMTYGWSILIIAVTLVILFSLGVFSNVGGGSDSCIANAGFLCTNMTFRTSYPSGADQGHPYLTLDIGQVGQTWKNVYVIATPEGQQITSPSGFNSNDFTYWGQIVGVYGEVPSLNSGSEQYFTIIVDPLTPLLPQAPTIGSKFSGTIWIMYSTPYTTNAIADIGTFTAVATST